MNASLSGRRILEHRLLAAFAIPMVLSIAVRLENVPHVRT